MGEGKPGGEEARHPGDDLHGDAVPEEEEHLLPAPAEDHGVAPFEADHEGVGPGVAEEEAVDFLLLFAFPLLLPHVDLFPGGEGEDPLVHEPVVEDHGGLLEEAVGLEGQKLRVPGARPHQVDPTHGPPPVDELPPDEEEPEEEGEP